MRQPTMTRALFSALLITTGLMAPNAQAMGSDASLDLRYEALEGETLYAVATADGDLRFFNEGPSAVQVHWYDGLTGEKDQRILGPGKSLLSYGSLGAQISEGTIILLEQMGPGAISKGIASIPTQTQFRGCVPTDPCYASDPQPGPKSSQGTFQGPQANDAFLPWHRGLYLGDDAQLHCTQENSLLLLGDEPQDFKGSNLHNNGAFLPFVSLEHGPGMHDSIHCIVGGTMCSATVMDKAIRLLSGKTKVSFPQCQPACYVDSQGVIWGQTIAKSLEHGPGFHDSVHCFTQPIDGDDIFMPKADSYSAGIPSCPELEHGPGLHDSMYIDDASSNFGGQEGAPFSDIPIHTGPPLLTYVLWTLQESGSASLEHGPGLHDSIHVWLPCPPYEPCDDVTVLSIWTAGGTTSIWASETASIWSDGTFSSIAPDGTVDL